MSRDLHELKMIIVVDGPEENLPIGVIHLNRIFRNKVAVDSVSFCPDIDIAKDLVCLPYSSGTTGKPKGVSPQA